MKIAITKASEWWASEPIIRENQTAQDILDLIKEFGNSIIISPALDISDYDYDITIYDSYVE